MLERVFVNLMEAKVDKNSLKSSTFEGKVWQKLVEDMKVFGGRTFSVRQLKDKHSRLQIKWREYENLKNQSGLGWNEMNQTVTCEPEIWNTYVKAHPGTKIFRSKGLANYDASTKIFQGSTAQGLLSRASTQMLLDSDEERGIDDEFAHPDVPIVDLDDEGDDAPKGKQNRKRQSCPSGDRAIKSSNSSKMDICIDAITSASKAKAELLKGQMSQQNKPQVVDDPFSMTACMNIINAMTGIQPAQVGKAVDLFAKQPVYREAFVGMNEDIRRMWLNSFVGVGNGVWWVA